ncbi:hypothetical protein CDL15_Pgr012959 [Punica granatum]|uniref:Leucine-rich repeat-containing N-terminal plant-type domain-containing protein n=1 Tax=Punica granatum TaxID=22663 RepID=A0A218XFB1_PUNGR|nr:hypothetical protein CDL15_Pgr012959 [Punica granatum]
MMTMNNIWLLPFLMILRLSVIAVAAPSNSTSYHSHSSQHHSSHISECDALLQFSNSFTISRDASADYCDYVANTSYPKTASWKNNTDCCSWDGVMCHKSTNHVIALDLSCSWLRGAFHSNSTLFSLPTIQKLNLAGNDFNGSEISPRFGIFTGMTNLSLSYSEFSGPIPLGDLAHLTHLDLRYNNLSDTVYFEMFARFENLQFLNLGGNDLTVLLQSNGNCSFPRLKVLGLSRCNLTKFPYFLSSSDELIELDLSGNIISGWIPEWFGRVRGNALTHLDLSSNNFTGEIPSSICQLSSLTYLYLSNNNLRGTIPRCLGNLSNLSGLHLGDNLLQGPLPRSLANCTSLQYLIVSYNDIYDTFPHWLLNATFHSLYTLGLQSNKFHGVISEIPLSPHLSYLRLSNNQFSGPFPINFYQNSSVDLVDLSNNNFEGPLPVPPPTIRYYLIPNNNFSGSIPSQICHNPLLEVLDLSINSLTGSIPHCLINLNASLSVLDLGTNELFGQMPDIFVPMTSLRVIRMSQNRLGGKLPPSLAHCDKLEILDLSENKFYGSFPNWLETLQNLKILVLRSNQFHSLVESSNRTNHPFPALHIFDLSNNDFYGPLPFKYIAHLKAMKEDRSHRLQYMGQGNEYYHDSVVLFIKGSELMFSRVLTFLKTIDLSSNSFDGEISMEVGDLKGLQGLNFSHNNLIGNIPYSMGNLINLEWLHLSSNKLKGEIPRGLADLQFLSWLDLSDNQLVGPIPPSMQFDTFPSVIFGDNPGLCGHPLPKACREENNARKRNPSTGHEEESSNSIEWRAVLMGYGCGLSFGISACYIMLETMRPRWLVRMVEREIARRTSKPKKNFAPRNHGRYLSLQIPPRIYIVDCTFLNT